MSSPSAAPVLEQVRPSAAIARRAVWAYMHDVVSRYYGRPATDAEVETAIREDPGEDLEPPTGVFVVAVQDGAAVGCAGLRLLPGALGEVTRVHVVASARRRGIGTCLMRELERLAVEHGRTTLRLDTRSDLVEARRLYGRLGYREVPAFTAGPHAEHWFEKTLS